MKISMKTLSVQNPWAFWIMHYGKTVENRAWKTKYRGRILIHASLRWDNNAPLSTWLVNRNELGTPIEEVEKEIEQCKKLNGHILGSVELYDCVQNADDLWAQPGLWHWLLRDPDIWEQPVLIKGSLGLWTYTGEA